MHRGAGANPVQAAGPRRLARGAVEFAPALVRRVETCEALARPSAAFALLLRRELALGAPPRHQWSLRVEHGASHVDLLMRRNHQKPRGTDRRRVGHDAVKVLRHRTSTQHQALSPCRPISVAKREENQGRDEGARTEPPSTARAAGRDPRAPRRRSRARDPRLRRRALWRTAPRGSPAEERHARGERRGIARAADQRCQSRRSRARTTPIGPVS